MPETKTGSILALDIGTVRIGCAVASQAAGVARPLTTIQNDSQIIHSLQSIIKVEHVVSLVVGLPRGLEGQSTAQTTFVERFMIQLIKQIRIPFVYQDEALSSVRAEEELQARGKTYKKTDIDALAATFILEDYLSLQREKQLL